MPSKSSLRFSLLALGICFWFLWHAWYGLLVPFTGDDVMNMYKAWEVPFPRLLWSNLWPFTSEYRPLGTAVYRGMYVLFGYQVLCFRLFCFLLMLVNIGLSYLVAVQLTGSRRTGALTALVFSFHGFFVALYANTGTVYDVLCCTCFWAAFVVYTRMLGSPVSSVGFIALTVMALNAKEMAATLPLVLWIYELVYRTPGSWKPLPLARWTASRSLPLWIVTILVPVSILLKQSSSGALANNPGYAMTVTLQQYLSSNLTWLGQMFGVPSGTDARLRVGIVLALLVCASLLWIRNRHLVFCAALIVVLPLPVSFIPFRDFYVMYLPYVAWALLFAMLLDRLQAMLARAIPGTRTTAAIAAGSVVVAVVLSWQHLVTNPGPFSLDQTQVANQALSRALADSCPSVPARGAILLQGDGFQKDVWDPLFVVRLMNHSKEIVVRRTDTEIAGMKDVPGQRYDCTLRFDGSKYVAVR